jgi:hypothetical protein
MEAAQPGGFTRAGEIANELVIEAMLDPDRYPEGTTFLAVDQDGFETALAEALAERRPLAIVSPDGREIIAAPRGGPLAFLARRFTSRPEPSDSVVLPDDYRVEIRPGRAVPAG